MSEELKPCPFCGSSEIWIGIECSAEKICCQNCGASIGGDDWKITKDGIIKKWTARAGESDLRTLLERWESEPFAYFPNTRFATELREALSGQTPPRPGEEWPEQSSTPHDHGH